MIAPPKPPSQDELEALIKEARARQLRRRLLGAAGVAILAALGLAVYALTIGGGSQRVVTNGSTRSAASFCRSSQLSAAVEWPTGALTPDVGWVVLTNRSSTACLLPSGVPSARITWRGRVLPTQEEHRVGVRPAAWMPLRTAHVLRPGGRAGVTFEWRNWCGRPQSLRSLMTGRLRFGSARVSFRFGPHAPCQDPSSPSVVQISRPLVAS